MRHLAISILAFSLAATPLWAADDYQPGPDSKLQEGVPKGVVSKYSLENSRIFPGTYRDYWVYLPAGFDAAKSYPFMVFQDGIQYQAPVVFDNLIQKKEIPPMIGIFVTPGRVRARSNAALDRFNRSYEYDGLGDAYARFLIEELLPHIAKEQKLNLSTNADDRGIAGASSGAICAFTAAWERPDAFRRVFSSIGTYVGLRGGNVYPTLIRKVEPKPIRIFLQDGSADQNIYGGDWWMANQEMERALVFAGYDVNHAWGDGGHNGKQATQVFPDAMRWLWRDYPAGIKANAEKKSKQPVAALIGDNAWELVGEGYKFTEGPAANAKGEIFFSDIPNNRIHKIGLDGKVSVFAEGSGGANGLMFGPDGRLYACAHGKRQIVAYDEKGRSSVVAKGLESNDLTITSQGDLYVTDPAHQQIWLVKKNGDKKVVDQGVSFPHGVLLSPDQNLLYVADMNGQFIYSYVIQPDGSLASRQRYYHLHLPDGETASGADGMTVDADGWLYVATKMGVQVCDQAGRVNSIIARPQGGALSNLCLGGAKFDELFATAGDKVFKRKLKAKGVLSSQGPIRPPAPRL